MKDTQDVSVKPNEGSCDPSWIVYVIGTKDLGKKGERI